MASAINFTVKWSGTEYKITKLFPTQTVEDLKNEIYELTKVLPQRQKILGLKYKGKDPSNDTMLCDLNIRPGQRVMMIGTREEELTDILNVPKDLPEVINDFDIDEEEIAIENRDEYLAKIAKRVHDNKITILNEPRAGKKLLVLDIDYTIFDHRSVAENVNELMRPFLHEFLTEAYLHYDIAIWSATSMKWIEVKMKELGVSLHPHYKLCFMLDSSFMISVHVPEHGLVDVKPLGVIWGNWPQWTHRNTIMLDDIRKNFLMNPQNGLRIRPFREARLNRHKDRELVLLARYLVDIAELDDLSTLNHRKWEKYRPHKKPSSRSNIRVASHELSAAVTAATGSDQSQDKDDTNITNDKATDQDQNESPDT